MAVLSDGAASGSTPRRATRVDPPPPSLQHVPPHVVSPPEHDGAGQPPARVADLRRPVREALRALGIRRFLLGIHDAAFPTAPVEDVGTGSPHSGSAAELLGLASALGFDGLQLGPQGALSAGNASPYEASLFSRNPLSISLPRLTRPEWGALLSPERVAEVVAGRPATGERVAYAHAFAEVNAALAEAAAEFRRRRAGGTSGALAERARQLRSFRARHGQWLERDALYEVLRRRHGGAHWERWPDPLDRRLFAPAAGDEEAAALRRRELLAVHAAEVEDYAFVQFVAHEQHRAFRAEARALGLDLFADLQVGLSERDAWYAQGHLLQGWRMGAPPSRTDPQGQPWGFAVADPRAYREVDGSGRVRDGPALRFLRARARKLLDEYDGLRVDHPHGLVTPWVYAATGPPGAAVRAGARLFDSPDLPELAAFAIARAEQLDRTLPRHADRWVRWLDDEQVERYAVLFDALIEGMRDRRDVACEILSTQPHPLQRVIERHGLGRFRITQKANVEDPRDVYRGENAAPEDWIMLGNHDTRPIGLVVERWRADGTARRHAEYLAYRLLAPGEDREAWVAAVAADPAALAQAQAADLFVGPAGNVVIYVTDLLGADAPYNVPGTVSEANWSWRVPHGVASWYRERAAAGVAIDVPRAVARALRARGSAAATEHRDVLAALEGARPGG
jgi:4-alpha-glucanotransferase